MTRVVRRDVDGTLLNEEVPDFAYIGHPVTIPTLAPIAVADFKNGVYSINGVAKTIANLWIQSADQVNWGPFDPAVDIVGGSGLKSGPTGNRGPVSTPELWAAVNVTDGFTFVVDINPDRTSGLPGGFGWTIIDDMANWTDAIVIDQRSNFVRHIIWNNGGSYSPNSPAIPGAGKLRVVTTIGPKGTVSYMNNGGKIITMAHPVKLSAQTQLAIWTKECSDPSKNSFLEKIQIYPGIGENLALELAAQ